MRVKTAVAHRSVETETVFRLGNVNAKLMPMKSLIDNNVRVAMGADWPTASHMWWFFFLDSYGVLLYNFCSEKKVLINLFFPEGIKDTV